MRSQTMTKRIIAFISILSLFPAMALAQTTFDQALQEGKSLGNAGPGGKDAADSLISGSLQNQGVPGLTPESLSEAGAKGRFFFADPDQLKLLGEGRSDTTESGRFLQQSYNLRPKSVISPDDPIVTLSKQAAGGTQGCITQRICTKPVSEVVTNTQELTCSIEYGERPARCTYDLPQPTTGWQPWLKVELVGRFGWWHFRLHLDTDGDGAFDRTLNNPSGAQTIRAFHTGGRYILQWMGWWNWWWGPFNVWTLNPSGSWVNPPAPVSNAWWWASASGPTANRRTAGNLLKEIVRQAYGIPAEEIRIRSGSESFSNGSCFNLGSDRCYSAVWERSYLTPPPPVSEEQIQAACGIYMNEGCTMIKEDCTTSSCTRSYLCVDQTGPIDGCTSYREKGCALNGSICSLKNQYGQCLTRQETYACTTETTKEGCAEESVQVICPGSPEGIRCLDPNECADTTSQPSTQMTLAASHMGGLNAVEDDHAGNPVIVFRGSGEFCRKTIASGITRNCCTLDAVLLGCNTAEKGLQGHRQAGQCVGVGTYCSRKVNLGFTKICVERTTGFCCFSSKLTRIIQEQGRRQLGIGWGSPANPNCRGLTTEELQGINFEQIDFSEYYSDITADPPDPAQLTAQTEGSQALTPDPNQVPPPPSGISQGQVRQDVDRFFQTHGP
ncbi:MAG: conjugal transfer protein TraN [Nitrospiria bacterium]